MEFPHVLFLGGKWEAAWTSGFIVPGSTQATWPNQAARQNAAPFGNSFSGGMSRYLPLFKAMPFSSCASSSTTSIVVWRNLRQYTSVSTRVRWFHRIVRPQAQALSVFAGQFISFIYWFINLCVLLKHIQPNLAICPNATPGILVSGQQTGSDELDRIFEGDEKLWGTLPLFLSFLDYQIWWFP